jgi:hypothetical protein
MIWLQRARLKTSGEMTRELSASRRVLLDSGTHGLMILNTIECERDAQAWILIDLPSY